MAQAWTVLPEAYLQPEGKTPNFETGQAEKGPRITTSKAVELQTVNVSRLMKKKKKQETA